MSTYADASLIYYPSGYKAGTVYSLKPTDGSGDLTFTRASSATRVNAAGLIEDVEIILPTELIVNGDFENGSTGWSLVGDFAISGGKASITSASQYSQLTSQGTNFLIAGKQYKLQLDIDTLSKDNAFAYRFSGGAVTPILTSQIVDGKFEANFTMPSNGYLWLQTTGSYTGLNVSIDNVSVKEVITNNIPRIDYTGGGCGKLLLEPQRTNLVTYSEQFDNAAWVKFNATITANDAISPDGTTNADKLTEDASNSFHATGNNVTSITNGLSYSFSVFAKKAERNVVQFAPSSTFFGSSAFVNFDLQNGVISASGGSPVKTSITSFNNDWYKCEAVFNATQTGNGSVFNIVLANSITMARAAAYQGDSTSGVYIYGAQLEAGSSYPTSYIPTTSTAVTRVADSSPNTSFLDYNSDFTFFYSSNTLNNGTQNKYYDNFLGSLSDFNIQAFNLRLRYVSINYAMTAANTYFKLAIVKNSTNMKIFLDGVLKFTITTLPSGSANITLLESEVLSMMTFPTALSDADAITLTTL